MRGTRPRPHGCLPLSARESESSTVPLSCSSFWWRLTLWCIGGQTTFAGEAGVPRLVCIGYLSSDSESQMLGTSPTNPGSLGRLKTHSSLYWWGQRAQPSRLCSRVESAWTRVMTAPRSLLYVGEGGRKRGWSGSTLSTALLQWQHVERNYYYYYSN